MTYDPEFITRLIVGNLGYVLLVVSMMMTRMVFLRMFGLASGVVGGAYMWFWLYDPVLTFWEGVFATACAVQIAWTAYRNRATRFSDDDRTLQTELMPDMEPRHLRALLRVGSWQSAEPGTELVRQGELARHLIFLKSGGAGVLVNGSRVGTCRAGDLVGEIGFTRAEPANATVVADNRIRYFAMERDGLRRLVKSCPEIASLLSRCNRKDVEKKLIRMNEAMFQALATTRPQPEDCEIVRPFGRRMAQISCKPGEQARAVLH